MRALILAVAVLAATRAVAQDEPFGPSYVLEAIEIRGNHKTETGLIRRELGLEVGEIVRAADPRVDEAKLRLLSLGYFLNVNFSLSRGGQRGGAVLVVEVEERGTVIINAIHLGTSDATALWGGLDLAETNFLGRGISLGGGFVESTRPKVAGADPARALTVRAAGPPSVSGLSLGAQLLYSRGSEFFRAAGPSDSAAPGDFVALRTRRVGGALGVGLDLSASTRLHAEGRYEAVDAKLPGIRSRDDQATLRPIIFPIHEGVSHLSSLSATLDIDTRNDPVLPSRGGRALITFQASLPVATSHYLFGKGVLQGSRYFPIGKGALGLHGFGGALFGDAPYFEQFFVGDLNLLLPQRAYGLNFSTQPSRDLLGTGIAEHRYDAYATRALVEYALPLWRRHGFVYRADAFVAFGAFAMASGDDLRVRDRPFREVVPVDLTADLGLRLDTPVGIFTVSVANALGRIPF